MSFINTVNNIKFVHSRPESAFDIDSIDRERSEERGKKYIIEYFYERFQLKDIQTIRKNDLKIYTIASICLVWEISSYNLLWGVQRTTDENDNHRQTKILKKLIDSMGNSKIVGWRRTCSGLFRKILKDAFIDKDIVDKYLPINPADANPI
jgi:hypothetical protein